MRHASLPLSLLVAVRGAPLHHLARDGQAQADAAEGALLAVVLLLEGLEDALEVRGRDADAFRPGRCADPSEIGRYMISDARTLYLTNKHKQTYYSS